MDGVCNMNEFLKTAGVPPENCVLCGNVRFSIIEPRLIRIEWSGDGVFDDRPTQNVRARNMGNCSFSVQRNSDALSIDTGALQILYRNDGKPLSADNLKISFRMDGKEVCWKYGDSDPLNLKGAAPELDMVDGDVKLDLMAWVRREYKVSKKLEIEDGLLSRSGWSVFDDSRTAVVVEHPVFGEWFEKRPAEKARQDIYFFGFGHDYKAALLCGAKLFGYQPLPPHYAFGYWFSRYWAYSDTDLEELTGQFSRTQTPLDVLVVDTDWHLPGWTGFTWDKDFFPDPAGFLKSMKKKGLHLALNLHPERGVAPHEKSFNEFRKAMGSADDAGVPFDIENPEFMDLYFKLLLNPEERKGVDFWWMDSRQSADEVKKSGFSPVSWINRLHWLDQVRRNPEKRPVVFSTRGGMDGCRYPLGFSADACSTWATLAKEVEFTATSANVLSGYWSHDIGGHMELEATSPELYLRWMQFGVCSPVLRSHSAKFEYVERLFWNFPAPYNELLRNEILRRHRMIPYIYGECSKGCNTGISLCRPLYYEYPEDENAYRNPGEYFLGDSILAAPVTAQMDPETELAKQTLWLPPGEWYDISTGMLHSGGKYITEERMLSDLPLFVRPGTILPEAEGTEPAGASGVVRNLTLSVYPGECGEYELYEDDGESTAYQTGAFVKTKIRHWKEGNVRYIEILPALGKCKGFLRHRSLKLRLHGVVLAESVKINGRAAGSCYCGETFTLSIELLADTRKCTRIEVRYKEKEESAPLFGWLAASKRLKRLAYLQNRTAGCTAPVKDDRLAQKIAHFGRRITLRPSTWKKECGLVKELLPRLQPSFEELLKVRGKLFPFSMVEVKALLAETEKYLQ